MLARIIRWGSPVVDSAQAWTDAVRRAGGSVSANRLSVVRTFIAAERASGAWDLTDDYWALWGENATQALTSLKQRRLAAAVNTPSFTSDRDYTFDGATNYVDTGFIPSTHGVAMTDTNIRVAAYERTNVGVSSTYAAGAHNTSNRRLSITPRNNSTSMVGSTNGQTASFASVSDSRGLTSSARNGALVTDQVGYRNGVLLTRSADSSGLGTRPIASVMIGCVNSSGATGFRAASIGFLAVGATLSGAQELAQYNAIQAWATSLGANV